MPHRVRAERLAEPWSWVTSNGSAVRAEPGDYRLTDVATAAQWSIAARALRTGYVEVSPGEYETTGEIAADRVLGDSDVAVPTLEGTVVAHPGDWVVTAADGTQWVVVDSWFRDRYEPIPPDSPTQPTTAPFGPTRPPQHGRDPATRQDH